MKKCVHSRLLAVLLVAAMVFSFVGNIPMQAFAAAPTTYTNIAEGETKTATFSSGVTSVYFRFVPQYTGTYIFQSSDSGDPKGYLLDSSGATLTYDDDGGAGSRDFQISYTCTAGTTYYLQATTYNGATSGSYTVTVTGSGGGTPIVTTPGTTAYTLFNSGNTSSTGQNYSDSSNPAPGTLTNNGYDIYASASRLPRTRLGLSFTVTSPVTELSYLTIKAFDVDESSGERDLIYLVDATTGTKTQLSGYLSGQDWEWNDTTFRIDPALFTVGHEYYFELYESVSGWVVYVRTVDLLLGTADDENIITDYNFEADISASGLVTAVLSLTTSADATYSLEYAAVSGGNQYGSLLNQSIDATTSGTTKTVTFQLESGAPEGNYQIEVTVRDAGGSVVATYTTTTSGPNNSTVTYNANGGSNNLPVDQNVYRSGDTVIVLFDYIPSKTGYEFQGWARSSTASQPEFTEGGTTTFTIGNDDVTLYAVWRSESISTTTGTVTYALFNSGATTSYGREYDDTYNVDNNPDSYSFTNSGYDIYGGTNTGYHDLFVGMGLTFTITEEVIGKAKLTIYAYDIDEEWGQVDEVYLVDNTTGERVVVGTLCGRDSSWSTTYLEIDASLFTVGHSYYFEDNVDDGWWTWIRQVSLEVTVGEPTPPPVDSRFNASISASGQVSTELYLKSSEDTTYTVEYTAVISSQQKGGKEVYGIAVSTTGTTISDSFALDAGSPEGTYEITAIIKDAAGNTVMSISTTAGYAMSAVAYDPNGGTLNCPTDRNAYSDGDTVTVLFDTLPSKPGFTFLGWARSSTASRPEFTENGIKTFVIGNNDVTLYAVWGSATGTTAITIFNSGHTDSDWHWAGHGVNPAPDTLTNNGYDIHIVNTSFPRSQVGISFTITSPVVGISTVTFKAYDVNESEGERALVYLVDATTGTKTQLSDYLHGAASTWQDTTFQIDPSLFTVGHEYYFEVHESASGWGVLIRKVDLELATNVVPTVTVEAPAEPVILDQTFEVYFVVSDSDPLKSAAFVPAYDQSIFELVSVEWVEAADLQFITPEIASAWATATDVNGRLLKLVFKAKALTSGSEITTEALYSVDSTIQSFNVVSATVEVIECPHANYTITSLDDAQHLATCTVCGHEVISAHSFDNTCDTDCNVCGYERTITHTPAAGWDHDDAEHWQTCSVCGVIIERVAHEYDNTCDTDCNVCGYERTITHTPAAGWDHDDAEHWQICSVCGVIIGQNAHEYDSAYDGDCNICGYSRVIRGDVDGDLDVDSDDAIRVLLYTYFPGQYALNQSGDFDGDGDVDSDDSIHLLLYTYFPAQYPLSPA